VSWFRWFVVFITITLLAIPIYILRAQPALLSFEKAALFLIPLTGILVGWLVLKLLQHELREREVRIQKSLELLKISEAKYQALFQEAPVAYLSLSGKGHILESNAAAEKLLGIPSNELKTKIFFNFLPEAQRPNDEIMFRELLNRRGPPVNTERTLLLDADEKTAILHVIPVEESVSDSTRFRVVLFDVTERRRIEQQMMRSQKLESVGRLAGGIAHDFNNELSGMLGYAGLLKSKLPADSPLHSHVEMLEQGAQRAAQMTKQLLTLARHQEFKPEMIKFNTCVERAMQFVRASIPSTTTTHLKLCNLEEPIPGDTVNIEQILINLILNARDSIHESGNITVKTEVVNFNKLVHVISGEIAPGSYLKCSVIDDGTGMTNQAKEHLFEPFFSTKGVGRGTGLGLAMVYQIMIRHKGYIDCESEWRKGTSIHLYFPFIRHNTSAQATVKEPPKKTRKKKIMVVDDEVAIRELAKTVLQDTGYEVVEMNDGQDAVEFFTHDDRPPIDLIIMDMVMPRKDGVEAYHEIRKIDPYVPIVFSSGYIDTEQTRKAHTLGLSIALPKPYRIEQLLDITETHLKKESKRQELAAGIP
jgi:PAS domain S-box-containing protein